MWNGRVLLGRKPVFAGDRFSASYFETDFASFLAWRDWGFPDKAVFNGSGMGALRCADGAFVLGEMGQHTSNAGRIYFPSGTPDLDDIRDGAVDIPGSVVRELEEETGLEPGDYRSDADWHCVSTGPAVAMIRILHVDISGEALRGRIEANLALQRSPNCRRSIWSAAPRDLTVRCRVLSRRSSKRSLRPNLDVRAMPASWAACAGPTHPNALDIRRRYQCDRRQQEQEHAVHNRSGRNSCRCGRLHACSLGCSPR